MKKHAFLCGDEYLIFQIIQRTQLVKKKKKKAALLTIPENIYNFNSTTHSSITVNHRETCCSKGGSLFPVIVIPSFKVLVFAWVQIYEQKTFDCFLKFSSSSLSGISSRWSNCFLLLAGRSKMKHFRLGKNFLIHSLGKLEF